MIEIPNYEIGKMAGKGGVAEVYLAKHKLLDRSVAIKIISPTQTDAFADKRFLKEAKVVAGLHHPNIVSIYDVGVLENKYYFVMEYLEGGDLKQLIRRGISVSQSLAILKQIASALAHAHSKKFIHRDIKSQNIMFRSDGTAVLTDFGIVKDLAVESGYTVDGTSIGTPHYMSPEQAQGSSAIDWRTDLYSLGVMFYEMLTGSVPYNADSAIAVALKHIKEPVPQLPDHLDRFQPIIDKLMAKKPDKRFQSAQDLIHAIEALEEKGFQTASYQANPAIRQEAKPIRLYIFLALVLIFCCAALYRLPYIITLYNSNAISKKDQVDESKPDKSPEGANAIRPEAGLSEKNKPRQDASAPLGNDFLTTAIAQKEYAGALNYISKTRGELREPSNETIQKADSYMTEKQFMNAGEIYLNVLSTEPRNKSASLGLLGAAIEEKQDLETRKTPSITEFDAFLSLLNQAIESADSSYFRQLKTDTGEFISEKYKAMAVAAQKDKKFKDAASLIQKARSIDPDNKDLQNLEWIISGDNEPSVKARAEFYLKAFQADPGNPVIREKIESAVKDLEKTGNADEAATLLTKAMQTAPNDSRLNDMMQSISQFQKEKNKIHNALNAIKKTQSFQEKIELYKTLFSNLNFATIKFNKEKVSGLKQEVIEQVKNDVQSQKNKNQTLPPEFMDLVISRLPEVNDYVTTVQYDILIQNGDGASSKKESADYYLEALRLNKTRTDAKDKIVFTAMNLQKSGMQSEATAILQKAADIAPDNSQFTQLLQNSQPAVKVFVTESGCGRENIIISRIPASVEKLNLCIQYTNFDPDSLVKVVFQSMEIPVVLNGLSGSKPVSITAPMEGFSPGQYSIVLKQKGKIISETSIEFVSKRR